MRSIVAAIAMVSALSADPRNDPKPWQRHPDPNGNPDAKRDMVELVESRGYAIEKHFATTNDGYILGMFRMPPSGKPNGKAVLLQHGLLCSSFDYVVETNQSLGFILADKGYDVWFGNNRGNTYSKNHTTLSPTKDAAFWNFTFSEMGRIDLPTMINYVVGKSGKSTITYFGHSEGTMQAWEAFGMYPELAHKVDIYFALAPVAHVSHMTSRLLNWAAKTHLDQTLGRLLFGNEFFAKGFLTGVISNFCNLPGGGSICEDVFDLILGKSKHIDPARMVVYTSQMPAGTATKNVIHFAQGIRQKTFGEFDYGKRKNMEHYNQATPPQYDLSKVQLRTVLVTGGADDLADPQDVETLEHLLPPGVVSTRDHIHIDDYSHMDFVWAQNAHEVLYPQILSVMEGVSLSVLV
jgi:pimeloyl-ACP methyl ester carboxylesterase